MNYQSAMVTLHKDIAASAKKFTEPGCKKGTGARGTECNGLTAFSMEARLHTEMAGLYEMFWGENVNLAHGYFGEDFGCCRTYSAY